MLRLPVEIILIICTFLSPRDTYLRIRPLCRRSRNLVDTHVATSESWRRPFRYPHSPFSIPHSTERSKVSVVGYSDSSESSGFPKCHERFSVAFHRGCSGKEWIVTLDLSKFQVLTSLLVWLGCLHIVSDRLGTGGRRPNHPKAPRQNPVHNPGRPRRRSVRSSVLFVLVLVALRGAQADPRIPALVPGRAVPRIAARGIF